jgi:hypothetical protein
MLDNKTKTLNIAVSDIVKVSDSYKQKETCEKVVVSNFSFAKITSNFLDVLFAGVNLFGRPPTYYYKFNYFKLSHI